MRACVCVLLHRPSADCGSRKKNTKTHGRKDVDALINWLAMGFEDADWIDRLDLDATRHPCFGLPTEAHTHQYSTRPASGFYSFSHIITVMHLS